MQTKKRTVDLFSGCGGMSLGFQNAGFDIVSAFDNWAPATTVYKDNFNHPVHTIDLYSDESINKIINLAPEIIIGGPPCQDYSSAGPKDKCSKRAGLVSRYAEIIRKSKPKYFVLENVPRLRHSWIFKDFKEALESAGYGLTIRVIDASNCGVPQLRKRLIVIGELGGTQGSLDTYIQKRLSTKQVTIREYLGDKLNTNFYFRVPTNYSRRGVFSVDEPSMTIRSVDRPIGLPLEI